MIIYGTKATEIANETIVEKCSQCGTQNSIYMSVLLMYAHVYWIPIFPKGKTGATQCLHCNHITQKEDFTENLTKSYVALKSKSKTPLWSFVGLVILLAFITFFAIRNN